MLKEKIAQDLSIVPKEGDGNNLDKILFENILFGQLKHVNVHKINSKRPSKTDFKQKVKKVINDLNF